MLDIIYGRDDELVPWAEAQYPDCKFRGDAKTIGMTRDGEIVAVVVYDTFSTTTCFVHFMTDKSKRVLSKSFIVHAFAYPFIQCGYDRISCIVAASNKASLRFTRHFGWVQEGLIRQGSPDGSDTYLFGMLRDECRFLPVGAGKHIGIAL